MSSRLMLYILVLFCLATSPAWADAGIPFLFATWPLMILALIPVVAIESLVLSRHLGLHWAQSLKLAGYANLISTLCGVPLTWLVLALISLALISINGTNAPGPIPISLSYWWILVWAPWLSPFERISGPSWLVPSATLILLVPFFFVSDLLEYHYLARHLKGFPKQRVRQAVFVANAASYSLLILVLGVLVLWRLTPPG